MVSEYEASLGFIYYQVEIAIEQVPSHAVTLLEKAMVEISPINYNVFRGSNLEGMEKENEMSMVKGFQLRL